MDINKCINHNFIILDEHLSIKYYKDDKLRDHVNELIINKKFVNNTVDNKSSFVVKVLLSQQ